MDQAPIGNTGYRQGLRREGQRRWATWSGAGERPTERSIVQTP